MTKSLNFHWQLNHRVPTQLPSTIIANAKQYNVVPGNVTDVTRS